MKLIFTLCGIYLIFAGVLGCAAAEAAIPPTADTPSSTSTSSSVPNSTTTPDGTIFAAGDVATCGTTGAAETARLLKSVNGPILGLGDYAYESGTTAEFANCYNPYWGQFTTRLHPAAGNHEYQTANAKDYFKYFGKVAGDPSTGYYSFDLGTWHMIALNSNCEAIGGCGPGSLQEQWLRADLSAHHNTCVLAYWHHPRFSSGEHGSTPEMDAFWQDLYAAHVSLVLNGHDHDYERFAPQNPAGQPDANGIREIIVGTGGASHYQLKDPLPNSQVRNEAAFGVLKLQLNATSYAWEFMPVAGETFKDTGSATCAGAPAQPTPVPAVYETEVRADKPVSYWRLDDPSGTTAITDKTNQNIGELRRSVTAGTPGALKSGSALSFAGTDGYIFVASSANLNIANDLSLEAWAKPTALDNQTHVIIEKGQGSTAGQAQYRLSLHSTDHWQGCVYIKDTEKCLESVALADANVWTHVALIRSSDTLTLYVNAQPVKSTQVTGAINSTDLMLALGRGGSESTRYFSGAIDEVAVYDHALTPERIRAHFDAASK